MNGEPLLKVTAIIYSHF